MYKGCAKTLLNFTICHQYIIQYKFNFLSHKNTSNDSNGTIDFLDIKNSCFVTKISFVPQLKSYGRYADQRLSLTAGDLLIFIQFHLINKYQG